jgi:hypothetical protein
MAEKYAAFRAESGAFLSLVISRFWSCFREPMLCNLRGYSSKIPRGDSFRCPLSCGQTPCSVVADHARPIPYAVAFPSACQRAALSDLPQACPLVFARAAPVLSACPRCAVMTTDLAFYGSSADTTAPMARLHETRDHLFGNGASALLPHDLLYFGIIKGRLRSSTERS